MRQRAFDLAGSRWLWTYFWLYLVVLYAPLVVLAVFSLHSSPVLALPWHGWSLRWYQLMLHSTGLLNSLRVSIVVAIVSACCAAAIGAALGITIARFQFPGSSLVAALALMPLVLPALGLAVALLLTFVAIGLQPSLATVVIGHTVVGIPSVVLLVATRVIGIDTSLEEAAMDLGATWRSVLTRIYLPLLSPALFAGFFSAFVVSFNDFYLADFLAGGDTTLPVYFFSGFRAPDLMPPTLALSTALTLCLIAVMVGAQPAFRLVYRTGRGGARLFGRGQRPTAGVASEPVATASGVRLDP